MTSGEGKENALPVILPLGLNPQARMTNIPSTSVSSSPDRNAGPKTNTSFESNSSDLWLSTISRAILPNLPADRANQHAQREEISSGVPSPRLFSPFREMCVCLLRPDRFRIVMSATLRTDTVFGTLLLHLWNPAPQGRKKGVLDPSLSAFAQ